MSLKNPNNNHNYAPAFQVSGIPFVTSSAADEVTSGTPIQVQFPYVTRWVVVRNTGGNDLRVGFTANGVRGGSPGDVSNPDRAYNVTGSNANFFILSSTGSSPTNASVFGSTNMVGPIEVKCTEMWFMTSGTTGLTSPSKTGFSLMAGYTNVPESQFLNLTGGDGWGFQGVG